MLPCVAALGLVFGPAVLVNAQTAEPVPPAGNPSRQGRVIPARRDIDDLFRRGPEWYLYILALDDMQQASAYDPWSWFQLRRIHGQPPFDWNGHGPRYPGNGAGYCPHAQALFLPWHRFYVREFERSLVSRALRIARQYPSQLRDRYIQAANRLRAPYWDWARNSSIPDVSLHHYLTITTPQGQTTFQNPLATYVFPREAFSPAFGGFRPRPADEIRRCDAGELGDNNGQLARLGLGRQLYVNFLRAESFEQISSKGELHGSSIEQLHDFIHVHAACGNQLSDLDYAGFDPLFWLLHAATDRYYAFWEATHPDQAFLSRPYRGGGQYATPQNTVIHRDSPIIPFVSPSGSYYTPWSASLRNETDYGYADIDWSLPTDVLRGQANRHFNEQYGPRFDSVRKRGTELARVRKIYFAHVSFRVEEMIERPVQMTLYLCGRFMGEIDILNMPHSGVEHASLPLDDAIESCTRRGSTPDELLNGMAVRMFTSTGRELPLASVPSMTMEVEDMELIPARPIEELPKIRNRHYRPAALSQFTSNAIERDAF